MNARLRPFRPALIFALWLGGIVSILLRDYHLAAVCLLSGWLLDDLGRPKPLKENQAIVSAPIEPSSDIRQFARAMTEIRTALIAEGMSSEEARLFIADYLAAQNRGNR